MLLLEAILGLSSAAGVLRLAEWWQHYCQETNPYSRLAGEAEQWLAHDPSSGSRDVE